MKILFFGTPEFAVATLDRIMSDGLHEVVGVVTAPDKPAGRGHSFKMSEVKEYALKHNLRLFQPVKLKDENFLREIRELNADVFVVVAFRMLPESVWAMPPMGTFNVHASLLPKFRGAAPINWAIIKGETRTGVTTFMLRHDIDTGPILSQTVVDILPEDNIGSLYDRMMVIGADLAADTLDKIAAGTITEIDQSQLSEAPCPAPKLNPENCTIDWNESATNIHNLIRGLSPYPGARSTIVLADGERIPVKIFKTAIPPSGESGDWTVDLKDGSRIEILELQPAGKKRMKAADYLRGLHCDRLPVFE